MKIKAITKCENLNKTQSKTLNDLFTVNKLNKAILRAIDDEDKLMERIVLSGQNREVIFINESGLYSLILSSKNRITCPIIKTISHFFRITYSL